MFRAATVIACAALILGPGGATAQGRWSLAANGGYANGIGGDFGGNGSVGVTAFAYRSLGGPVEVGLELGYHGFGTTTTRVADLYGAGSTYREDFSRSAWQATVGVRLRPRTSTIRLYVAAGGGAYLVRFRDVIEVRDAGGQLIPQYQFRQTDGELHPGVNAGVGVDRLVSFGRLGLGVHARWHGVIANGIGDFVTVGVGLTLD